MNVLLAIINILLSPFSFLLFLTFSFGKETSFYIKTTTNVTKLKLVPYLCFSFTYLAMLLLLIYLCNFYIDFNLWEMFIPKNIVISIITWGITIITLRTYLKGMEGNIMGFIFFPLLALSMLTLFICSFLDILSYHHLLIAKLPILKIDFWIRLILHLFFPFYLLIFLNTTKNTSENNHWIATIFSSLILQLIFFGGNWIAVYLFGGSLTFSLFFGEQQTILYYLPIIGSILYLIVYFVTKIISVKKREHYKLKTITYYVVFINCGLIFLEIINYLNLIIPFF
ncbi:hypothetical protein [Tenacibaculum insulae]|uniref:hypothetical protein n=1 Tax=Tenacibaculum insulae TaxID=2029677 RepID=UPI003AB85988